MEKSSINGHGADIYSASKSIGIDENNIIDFSSNINPLGVPKAVTDAIISAVLQINRYPDVNSRELVKSISSYENMEENMIFCGSGAAEVIFRIPMYLKPENALITAPTFSEYESALKTVNCKVNYYNLSEKQEFKITEDFLKYINSEIDIVFICNPNNPTGQMTEKKQMEEIISHCERQNTIVVVDECFIDFVEDKERYSVKPLLKRYSNLLILKAFTKIFAIPGVRLGYCLGNSRIIEGLKNSGPPWNVSNLAQAAGISALKETDYVKRTVDYVKKEREYLSNELSKLNMKVYKSYGNYILFRYKDCTDLKERMLEKGILIRSCSNYNNLADDYYRIAVKSSEDNKIFIQRLKDVIK